MIDYRFKFPELYQFFGGYFYQGWASDYRWEGIKPGSAAVVRHFKAVNPPPTVSSVRNQLEDLLREEIEEENLSDIISALGSSFYPQAENLSTRQWLEKILEVLEESQTQARILRELR